LKKPCGQYSTNEQFGPFGQTLTKLA